MFQKQAISSEQLNHLKKELKNFISKDPDFYDLASKYTFQYREFSSVEDYCEIIWDKRKKKWRFKSYIEADQKQDTLPLKKQVFYLNLSINGYDWGSLFCEMERCFINDFKANMSDREIEYIISNDYDRYEKAREDFFKNQKGNIIKNWFKLTEETLERYLEEQFERLEQRINLKKKFSF